MKLSSLTAIIKTGKKNDIFFRMKQSLDSWTCLLGNIYQATLWVRRSGLWEKVWSHFKDGDCGKLQYCRKFTQTQISPYGEMRKDYAWGEGSSWRPGESQSCYDGWAWGPCPPSPSSGTALTWGPVSSYVCPASLICIVFRCFIQLPENFCVGEGYE